MPQPYEIINLRKRLKANGYKSVEIRKIDDKQFEITGLSPLSGVKEIVRVTPEQAEHILRKHKPIERK